MGTSIPAHDRPEARLARPRGLLAYEENALYLIFALHLFSMRIMLRQYGQLRRIAEPLPPPPGRFIIYTAGISLP